MARVVCGIDQRLAELYGGYGEYGWAAEAVHAAVGWNFKFHPSEVSGRR